MQVGGSWRYFVLMLCSTSCFLVAQWEEQHTHILRTQTGGFGVTEIQMSCYFLILVNALSGNFIAQTKLSEMVDVNTLPDFGVPALRSLYGEAMVVDAMVIPSTIGSIFTILSALIEAYKKTAVRPRLLVYIGTFPLIQYWLCFASLFVCTDFGDQNRTLVTLMLLPLHCLIVSRQIVCTVTKMPSSSCPGTPFWYLLLPINRFAIHYFPEQLKHLQTATSSDGFALLFEDVYVVGFIAILTTFWYFWFVTGTIM